MSASRERKKRQEFVASGGTDPKAAREAERKAKERKSNILYGSIGVVFVLVAAFLVIYNSGVLQRNATAVTIDGENYSAADYSYYYNVVYQYYYRQYGTYTDMIVTADQLQEQTLFRNKRWNKCGLSRPLWPGPRRRASPWTRRERHPSSPRSTPSRRRPVLWARATAPISSKCTAIW